MKSFQNLLQIPRTAFYTALWHQHPQSHFSGVGRSNFGGLLTRLGQGLVPYPHLQHPSTVATPGMLRESAFPRCSCTTPQTREVTTPCRRPCIPTDDQIQACRKAAAEKILCRHGSEWAHHYWIKCIYFCQHLYDSWIAYFFTVGKKCSISKDCLLPLTSAQHLEYSHFRNPPVFSKLRGQSCYWCEVDHRKEKK